MSDILDQSAPNVARAIQGIRDPNEITLLLREEKAGSNRMAVQQALSMRLGEIAVAGGQEGPEGYVTPTAPEEVISTVSEDALRVALADEAPSAPPAPESVNHVNEDMEFIASLGAESTQENLTDLIEGQQARDDQLGTATTESGSHAITGGTVTHSGAKRVRMYHNTRYGWQPITVMATNVIMNLRQGYRPACPLCGRKDCMANGDQNDCPNRPKKVWVECPVQECRKRFWDMFAAQTLRPKPAAEADEFQVQLDADVTPQERVKARLFNHMRAVHPQEGVLYGLEAQTARNPLAGASPEATT